jgi:hypothetical protein
VEKIADSSRKSHWKEMERDERERKNEWETVENYRLNV